MSCSEDTQYYVLLAIVVLMGLYFIAKNGETIANGRELIYI